MSNHRPAVARVRRRDAARENFEVFFRNDTLILISDVETSQS